MNNNWVKLCVWCLWLCLLGESLALRENYCEKNVTVSSLVPVTKQRTIVKQPPKWKLWKKTQHITETYTSQEEQLSYKLISECCAGFKQTESGLCEPICERGCPAHASCVAPQRCQCTAGYISALAHRDGSHYCEPICERQCASGSLCVAPNTCACMDGYLALPPTGDAVSADCVPSCQLGNGCEHGECQNGERCVCLAGYQWQLSSHSCVQLQLDADVTELQDYLSSTTAAAVDLPIAAVDCEEGFVLYAGICRPALFESNEPVLKDCRQTGCGSHQTCSEHGNCSCNSGYVEELQTLKDNSTKLICNRGLLEELLSVDQAADEEGELNPLTLPVLGVASGFLLVLVLAGVIGGVRRRRWRESSEQLPKEPALKCEYSQKSYDVDEWVP
ncbi:nimC4 [Drosophila busckii]|uniref:NimC4 n=1 Tax=Drosophila busckii TaxID=30019 RepID=A0A0M4E264_DROBS|nr:nimC4 [Drosophila busckii]